MAVLAGRLWQRLEHAAATGLPFLNAESICSELALPLAELVPAIKRIADVGGIEGLSLDEIKEIARTGEIPAAVVVLTAGATQKYLRIQPRRRVHAKFVASKALLVAGLAAVTANPAARSSDGERIASMLGLTADQLELARSLPLADDDWDLYRNMPDDFYQRAWTRALSGGDQLKINKIAAVVARLCGGATANLEAVQKQIEFAEEALAFIEAAITIERPPEPGRSRIPEHVRHEVWRRDQGRCIQCGSKEKLEFDHVIPLSRGGADTARNLQLLCEICNRSKGDRI